MSVTVARRVWFVLAGVGFVKRVLNLQFKPNAYA